MERLSSGYRAGVVTSGALKGDRSARAEDEARSKPVSVHTLREIMEVLERALGGSQTLAIPPGILPLIAPAIFARLAPEDRERLRLRGVVEGALALDPEGHQLSCENCQRPSTHAEQFGEFVRAWCDDCVPWSGHHEEHIGPDAGVRCAQLCFAKG